MSAQQLSKSRWPSQLTMAIGTLVGIAGISLQFPYVLQIPGISTTEAVVRFFSFFTILTNLLVLFGYIFPLFAPASPAGKYFASASVRGCAVVYIVVVGAVYNLLLRQLYHPVGWAKVADALVHDIAPLLYVFYWLIFAGKTGLRWKDAAAWLAYPLLYLVYTLLRGVLVGFYPYPFIDVNMLGYPRVFLNAVAFTLIFWWLGLLVVALGRWMAGNGASGIEMASESAKS